MDATSYEDRLQSLKLWSLEERRNRQSGGSIIDPLDPVLPQAAFSHAHIRIRH